MKREISYTDLHRQFLELTERDKSYMERVCISLFPNDKDMQMELMQYFADKFLDVLIKWSDQKDEPMPQQYFRMVFQNICKRYYSQHIRYKHRHISLPPQLDIANDIEDDSLYQELEEYVAKLSPKERGIIEIYQQSNGTAHFAQLLGVSNGNARVILHRIVYKLKSIKSHKENGMNANGK